MSNLITDKEIHTGDRTVTHGYIRFDDRILEIGSMENLVVQTDDQIKEVNGSIIVPGFIDVHTHGGYGVDTMDADVDKINYMLDQMRHEGITSVFLTTITQSADEIQKALIVAKKVINTNPMAVGIHLEGPYINAEMNGAQPKEYVLTPDEKQISDWQTLSGNNIRLVTFAPEVNVNSGFEKQLKQLGIVASVGHSAAHFAQLEKTSISHVTHLFNRQRQMSGREPGVVGFGLMAKQVNAVELIVDGVHVSPVMVGLAVKTKGASGVEIITDSMRSKGLGDGISELGGQRVTVKDGQARLDDGHLAGSVLLYNQAFKNIQRFGNVDLDQAIQMSSINQAKEFELKDTGVLKENNFANFNVLDQQQNIIVNFVHGDEANYDA